jgi:hypothetical protein
VTATADVVAFAEAATPTDHALAAAQTHIEEILAALRQGSAAIEDAHPGGQPSAMNRAWRIVFATEAIAERRRWHAVGVTVVALQTVSARDARSRVAVNAVAVGCAVAEHIAAALASTSVADRWSHRTVAGLIGAGVAAGRLLDFDDVQFGNVIGLCATQAAGLAAVDESEAGVAQLAKVAADAVEAAVLARHGFTSAADGIGGRRGLFALIAPDAKWRGDIGAA